MQSQSTSKAWDNALADVAALGARQAVQIRQRQFADMRRYAKRLRDRVLREETTVERWLSAFYQPTWFDRRTARIVERYLRRRDWVAASFGAAA